MKTPLELLVKGERGEIAIRMAASLLFNLKALEFGAFFACFHLFRYFKVVQLFQNCAETFRFQQAFKEKKPFEDSPSGFKISF